MNSVYHIPITVRMENGNTYNFDVPTYYVEDEDIPCVVDEWLRSNGIDYVAWDFNKDK